MSCTVGLFPAVIAFGVVVFVLLMFVGTVVMFFLRLLPVTTILVRLYPCCLCRIYSKINTNFPNKNNCSIFDSSLTIYTSFNSIYLLQCKLIARAGCNFSSRCKVYKSSLETYTSSGEKLLVIIAKNLCVGTA